MDVAGDMPELSVGFDKDGFKHGLKKGANAVEFCIKVFSVTIKQVAHESFYASVSFLPEQEVKVVWHKTKGDDFNTRGKLFWEVFFKFYFRFPGESFVVRVAYGKSTKAVKVKHVKQAGIVSFRRKNGPFFNTASNSVVVLTVGKGGFSIGH